MCVCVWLGPTCVPYAVVVFCKPLFRLLLTGLAADVDGGKGDNVMGMARASKSAVSHGVPSLHSQQGL